MSEKEPKVEIKGIKAGSDKTKAPKGEDESKGNFIAQIKKKQAARGIRK